MSQKKTPLEAATSMAEFMLHRLQLGVAMFAFNQQQITDLVAQAQEYTKKIQGAEIDEKGEALYGIFFAMQLFDVEINPVYGMSGTFGYAHVLAFFETTKTNWQTALRDFASHYPDKLNLPEGYTYRIEDTEAKVED